LVTMVLCFFILFCSCIIFEHCDFGVFSSHCGLMFVLIIVVLCYLDRCGFLCLFCNFLSCIFLLICLNF
jgi:hypothetical protein